MRAPGSIGPERDRLAIEKTMAAAELRLVQAQPEPHFLFHALANVIALVRTHPGRAVRVLERLTSLLRASLLRARSAEGTLGDELRMCVTDSGVGLEAGRAGDGIGMANVRERRRDAFGERCRLVLAETPAGGVSAELWIPLTAREAAADA